MHLLRSASLLLSALLSVAGCGVGTIGGLCSDAQCGAGMMCVQLAEGPSCVHATDPCVGVSCGAHGQCVPSEGGATCQCLPGYRASGRSCVTGDPCEGISCGSGQCVSTGGSPSCRCDAGYESVGLQCTKVDPCEGVSCGANGRCVVQTGAASCQCDAGYAPAGLSCQRADPCATVTCGTGAHCSQGTCSCDDGLEGDPKQACAAPSTREQTVRAKLVGIAQTELGECEDATPEPYMTGQPGLWCYDFVAWVYATAGEGLGAPLWLPHKTAAHLAAGWRPKAGDLIKYNYQHYAMVKSVSADGNTVYTLEGNVNHCVMARATAVTDVEYYGALEGSF